MNGERTGRVFVTLLKGEAVEVPLLKYGNDIVPERFLGKDVELVRRWMDYCLAEDVRSWGCQVHGWDLLSVGEVN